MSVSNLLIFDDINQNSFISRLDTRIKIIWPLVYIFLAFTTSNIEVILTLFGISIIIAISVQGWISTAKLNYYLKYYYLLIIIFHLYFSGISLQSNTELVLIILRLNILLLVFVPLNRTITPDQLVNGLIKLGLPSNLAWSIGVSIRQAIFTIEDIGEIQQLQRLRVKYQSLGRFQRLQYRIAEVKMFLTSLLGRSIIIASEFGDTLITRKWQGAHRTISLYDEKLSIADIVFIITIIFIPLLIMRYL